MSVPKIIHQTWRDKAPHPALRACIASFHFMNPGWEVRYYTDEDCMLWLDIHAPGLKAAYMAFPEGIHRADLFRIIVLYYEGGVYADIDVECVRPLDELLSHLDMEKSVFLTRDHPIHERIHFKGRAMFMNDFMMARPRDPFLAQVLKWMLRCPPTSKAPAHAVMDTGPGILTAVVEMLGGANYVSTLQLMPSRWIHPIPDMTCQFPEARFYHHALSTGDWQGDDVYIVHYWYHTWHKQDKGNTLTNYPDTLLSTLGRQVERKLQWHLRDECTELDNMIACALAEFTEMRGTILCCVKESADVLLDRFVELLQAAGLRPNVAIIPDASADLGGVRMKRLHEMGGVVLRPTQLARQACNGLGSKVLLVGDHLSEIEDQWLIRHVQQVGGFVLGPVVQWADVVIESVGYALSEVCPIEQAPPRTVHFMPGHEVWVASMAESLAENEFSIRRWTTAELDKVLGDVSMSNYPWHLVPDGEKYMVAALAVLYMHGGVVFQGDLLGIPDAMRGVFRPLFVHGENFWLLGCPPKSSIVHGAIYQWQKLCLSKSGCDPRDFVMTRLKDLARCGHDGGLNITQLKPHEF